MSKTNNLTDFLTDIADAVRYATNTSDEINPQEFSDRIRGLKLSSSLLNVTSENTLSGDSLNVANSKKKLLAIAIEQTIINGETVYKIIQQKNETDNTFLDTLFYTEEGDASGYYYILNGVDNYLSKVSL